MNGRFVQERDARTPRRLRGDRGTTFVTALVVMFAVTGAAAVFLARDVNQRVSDRSALQSIAFQSARAGAQQIDVSALRDGGTVAIDHEAARRAASAVATRLADQYGLTVEIEQQSASADGTVWTVWLTAAGEADDEAVWATGVARAVAGG